MSSRQMRKLQRQRDHEEAKLHTPAADGSEFENDIVSSKPAKSNGFANLVALQIDDEDGDKTNDESAGDGKLETVRTTSKETSNLPSNSKSKKKKKRKPERLHSKQAPLHASNHGVADEIDEAFRELNIQGNASVKSQVGSAPTTDPDYERICTLLGVATKHLKVAYEMRNLFGKTAVTIHDEIGGSPARGNRRRQRGQIQEVDLESALKGHHAPGKGLPEIVMRRNPFIQGKPEWPKASTGGLTMEVVSDYDHNDGTTEFRFVHDKSYQEIQQQFQAFVQMGDPQNLIGLLIKNPYHISLLIQVSKIAKDQGDHALASDLLERALFTFGRVSTSSFNSKISSGKARLDFARPENRELWLAGWHYIRSLVMKGTHRTALEWAKLLLSLDPEDDPYAMRMMIHNVALRAHELKWLLDISGPSSQLYEEKKLKSDLVGGSHGEASLALASMQLRDLGDCRQRLLRSMNRLPWLFCRLFAELNLEPSPSLWGFKPRTDAETLLSEVYILQTKDLWSTPEATSLLMEVAHTIPKIDHEKIARQDISHVGLDVVRFVYLDNNPSLMALAPTEILHREINSDADPLPPDYSNCSYWLQRALLGNNSHDRPSNNFYDPLNAIRRLVQDDPEEDVEEHDNVTEENFEDIPGDALADVFRAAVSGIFDSNSWAGRLWQRVGQTSSWGESNRADDEGGQEGSDTRDDDMPPLLDEEGHSVGSDDELPELVTAGHRNLETGGGSGEL